MLNYLRWLVIVLTLLGLPTVAYAHKVKLFATAAGNLITGYAYFPGGGRVSNIPIKVWGPEGTSLGEALTNAEGEFSYTVTQRVVHTFTVDTGDGHHASYTVTAAELSDTLPLPSVEKTNQSVKSVPPVSSITLPREEATTGQSSSPQELEKLLEQVVSKQIRPLREQLDAYEDKIRFHDILSGIGYIFGIMGILFYFGKRTQ
jgi:nickel transport protein